MREIFARGADITERDNANLALAAARMFPVLTELFDRGGIDEGEVLRLVYRMAGEVYEQEGAEIPTMLKAPLRAAGRSPSATQARQARTPTRPTRTRSQTRSHEP